MRDRRHAAPPMAQPRTPRRRDERLRTAATALEGELIVGTVAPSIELVSRLVRHAQLEAGCLCVVGRHLTSRPGLTNPALAPFSGPLGRGFVAWCNSIAVVEVRGVEPRSAEPSASASPSAAISELSDGGMLMAQAPPSYPDLS